MHSVDLWRASGYSINHQIPQQSGKVPNQGAFIAAIDISRFRPIDEYKAEIDQHIYDAQQMQPAPGYDRSDLPGGLEWEREQEWSEIGNPDWRGTSGTVENCCRTRWHFAAPSKR